MPSKKPQEIVSTIKSTAAANARKAREHGSYVMDLPLHQRNILKVVDARSGTNECVQEESIYNHVKKVVDAPEKGPRYVSKFRPLVLAENKANKSAMRTMGPLKVEVGPYKSIKEPKMKPKPPERAHTACRTKRPPVPLRAECLHVPAKPKTDFTKTLPKLTKVSPVPAFTDSKGHRQILKNSGLVPERINKKDYGKIPKYLLRQQIENEKNAREECFKLKQEMDNLAKKLMSDEDRQTILQGLKKTWKKTHHDYQLLPCVLDTFSMIARKERLEKELTRLEADIAIFEGSNPIYLQNDDCSVIAPRPGPRPPKTLERNPPQCPSAGLSVTSS